jgi:outer membrane lipoprotein-sorting protein
MKKLIASLVFAVSVCAVTAQNDFKTMANPDGFKKQVASISGNIQSIKSDFLQEKHLAVLQKPALSSGEFYFEKGGKVRWEYRQPSSQSIIMNGDKFTMINDGAVAKTDARTSKAYKRINSIMANVLHGNTFGDDAFSYSFFEGKGQSKVVMTPRNAQIAEHLHSIELFFNELFKVDEMVMREPGGDFTVYKFTNQSYDEKLAPVIFEPRTLP